MGSTGIYILCIAILLLFSAFFSGSEIAFTSVNDRRLKSAAEEGNAAARIAWWVYEHYSRALTTILIGNNLVNIAASSLATLIAISLAGEKATTLSSVILTILLLLVGEITPKIVAKHICNQFVLFAATPLRILMWIFTPVVLLFDGINVLIGKIGGSAEKEPSFTEEEFEHILDTVEDEGVIDEDKTELIQAAMDFDDITVAEILTPRTETTAAEVDTDLQELLALVLEEKYSRIPIYEGTIDNIIGILPVHRFLQQMDAKGTADIRSLLLKPIFVHKAMKLDDALKRLRGTHVHMAIVLDEYGGTQGIVTMEDILEELVGEIWDETDDIVQECKQIDDNTYECLGTMAIHDFFDEMDYDDDDFSSEYTTLGGWAIEMLDAQPAEGLSFTYGPFTATVEKMDGMLVDRLLIKREEAEEKDEEDI